jgi:PAS domain S-box-containing protein
VDESKTKEQLLGELAHLRRRVAELENLRAEHQRQTEASREAEGTHPTLAESSNDLIVVTEHRRAEDALKESDERYRLVVENADEAILVAQDGLLKFINPKAKELIGYSDDESTPRPFTEFIHPDDQVMVAERHLGRVTGEQVPSVYPFRIVGGDGNIKWVEANAVAITWDGKPASLALLSDITERRKTEREIQQRSAQLEALREVGLALTAQLELDALLNAIVQQAIELLGANSGGLILYQPDRDVLEWTVFIGFDPESRQPTLQRGDGLAGKVWENGKPIIVDDYQQWEGRSSAWEEFPFSIVGVPICWGEEFLGVLEVMDGLPRTFSPADAQLLSLFATQAAIAIRNARLFEEARSQAERLAVVNRVARAVGAVLDLDDLMETVYQEVTSTLQADAFFIALYDEETNELDFRVQVDEGIREPPIREPVGAGWTSLVIDAKRPLLIRDSSHESDRLPSPEIWGTMKTPAAWLGVPMQIGEQVVGVICVQSYQPYAYGEEDQLLLSTIADQIAVAVETARLFQAEREQRELAEALEQAAAAVNSTLEPDDVADRILEQVERVVMGDFVSIVLIEGEMARMVRWRTHKGTPIEQQGAGLALPIAAYPNLEKMMQTGKSLVIPDTATDPDWMHRSGWDWIGSYVGAPIRLNDTTAGFLAVYGARPGQFDLADAQRLDAFASHVATAIENARLHQAVLDYADQLEQRVQERTGQLVAQYARLEAILHSTTDGIVVTDVTGEIVQVNSVAHAWLTQSLSPKDRSLVRKAVQELAVRAEERPERMLGLTNVDLELKAAPILEYAEEEPLHIAQGEPTAVIAIHDVSQLKTLSEMKTLFIANASDELGQPVSTIQSYAYLVQNTPPGEDQKRRAYLDALMQETNRLAQLVESIRQISRIYAGRLQIEDRPISINELVTATTISHRELALKRGLALEQSLAEPDSVASVDPEQMTQVLSHLVEDAIRYTPEGGQVTVSTGTAEAEGQTWATVAISDTGPGISQQDLSCVFERFFREQEPRSKRIRETGIRLMAAQEIVKLHAGYVTAESKVGEGTTFTIWLPVAKDEIARCS